MRTDRKTPGRPLPARDEPPRHDLRPHGLAIAAIWLALLIVYSNSFGAGLILDNSAMILRDPRIMAVNSENLGRIWTGEYWFTQSGNGLYRPLTTLSYLFNYSVLGNRDRPAGYHWVNYTLHAVNASLLYLLGLGIFGRKIAPSLALAMVWAVHPVLTESVTNVVGRADLLAAFGMLAGLLCYRRGWFAAAALAVAIGMFSKESAIIAPLIAVLYDLCFPPAASRRTRLWGYAWLALPCVIYFLLRPHLAPNRFPFTDNPLIGAGFLTARLTAVKVIGKYLGLLLFPLRLSSDYSYNAIPLFTWRFASGEDWQAIAALAACAAIGALAIYGWRRDRRWLFFIGLSAIGLAPTANIAMLIGAIMAERFLYVPAMGFAGCLVLALLSANKRSLLPVAVSVLCLASGARAYVRNLDWADDRGMSLSQVKAVPNSYKVHAFYAGSLDDSIRNVAMALAIVDPLPDALNTPVVYINAGKWYRDKGQTLASSSPAESARWYRRSLDVLLRGERIRQAANENRFQLHEQLGLTYTKLGDFSSAVASLETALQEHFSDDLIREISAAYLQMGNPYRAEVALWEGLLVSPQNQRFAAWLVDMYGRSDPASCALESQAGNSAVNVACPLVHEQICAASKNMTRISRAPRFRDAGVAQFGCPAGQ